MTRMSVARYFTSLRPASCPQNQGTSKSIRASGFVISQIAMFEILYHSAWVCPGSKQPGVPLTGMCSSGPRKKREDRAILAH